jgi:AraC family transcriptional regulator
MQNKIEETRLEYIKRINAVLDFVEKNLEADLSLEQLSKKAFFSPFHFHRIFSAIVGESINTYINRKRIEKIASILLVGSEESLNELAYRYGFNSDSSFSRSFKKYYGTSPTEFKTKGNSIISKIGIEPITLDKYLCSIDILKNWLDMNAQIEVKELQEIKLAGIAHIGEFDKIGNTYEALFAWAAQKGLLGAQNIKAVTIYHDNPRVTHRSQVRLSACLTIEKDFNTEGAVRKVFIQKGNYAIGHFEIGQDLFPKAWDSLCIWIVENGYQFRDGDYFEIYHNDHRTHPEHKFIVDICIPVEKGRNTSKDSPSKTSQTTGIKLGYYREEIKKGHIQKDYGFLISYIKGLRNHFIKEYPVEYKIGSIYQGNMNFTYFPFTPFFLKVQKLKIVIIFNHVKMRFEICLAGQNRQIQKKYWEMFRESNWNTYHVPGSVTEGFSIVDHIMVDNPDFDNLDQLTAQIDSETMEFIKNIAAALQ